MISIIEAIILGIIQGLTEWLPISSSGHLVITQRILGLNPPLFFDVMLHFGTLIVVLTVFRTEIWKILQTIFKFDFKTEEGKIGLFVILGSIPSAIFGYTMYSIIETFFSNSLIVGIMLFFTGLILFISEKRPGSRKISLIDSIVIGFSQALAIIPGLSRSGLTISTGLLRKIDRLASFKFSFLLSIPTILGAIIFESRELFSNTFDLIPVSIGIITSMIVGYISLKLVQKTLISKKFHLFAYYCWVVGIVIIVFMIL